MFNVGGPEMLVILLLALVVLGPQRLPEAARQIGKFMGELRRVSSGFQQELKAAMDDPLEAAARERGSQFRPADPGGPAVAPAAPAAPAAPPAPAKQAGRPAPRRRTAPLRAVKPDGG